MTKSKMGKPYKHKKPEVRESLAICGNTSLFLHIPPESGDRGESGANHYLWIHRLGKSVELHLTGLTEIELLVVRDFINRAIEMAMPIVQTRDQEAAQVYNEGEDQPPSRVFRTEAKFVILPHWLGDNRPGYPNRDERQSRGDDTESGSADSGSR